MRHILIALTLATSAAICGCATDTPRVDAQLGKSVAHMIESQTYNPNAAANPPALAPETGDGQRLKNAIDAHRKDVSKGTEEVAKSITLELGKQ